MTEPQKKDDHLVSLFIRPQDKSWVMGEDWEIQFSYMKTLFDLKIFIEENRGISRHRMQLRLKGKVLVPNRENWTLRRTGIYDGYVILVEPTLSGSWLWNPYDYYANKLLDAVRDELNQSPIKRMLITDLEAKVVCPPFVKTSLRAFLRKYPEQIHIHVETTENRVYIEETRFPTQLPSYDAEPIEIGYIKYYEPEPFDWEAYADVDDMHRLEVFEHGAAALSTPAPVSAVVNEEGLNENEESAGEQIDGEGGKVDAGDGVVVVEQQEHTPVSGEPGGEDHGAIVPDQPAEVAVLNELVGPDSTPAAAATAENVSDF